MDYIGDPPGLRQIPTPPGLTLSGKNSPGKGDIQRSESRSQGSAVSHIIQKKYRHSLRWENQRNGDLPHIIRKGLSPSDIRREPGIPLPKEAPLPFHILKKLRQRFPLESRELLPLKNLGAQGKEKTSQRRFRRTFKRGVLFPETFVPRRRAGEEVPGEKKKAKHPYAEKKSREHPGCPSFSVSFQTRKLPA
jgi:hypothetical protein